ncbi:DUF1847 domain-containing protein [Emergencia timonensis]|uniref:DUF1847 domain-containing protein n=2 Tax=Emergencia timonensis TaxID=1776384 RepID=A0A415E8E5_9FIRM|nr:DUF1847 domain-containing protein [Emergencia timonensis]MBS6177966.1 DUF1847 domain-containing protein [Clostridiales bacterium]MCB6478205.1 DUF1847 domain-containing protein [Emergencia timonensis]RHJ90082.1 DUF1847 domain-containing protein [Emergencia timonensis]
MKKDKNLSCVDCGVLHCDYQNASYPEFCQTEKMTEAKRAEIMALYEDEENNKVMKTAAEVEFEGYCKWTRVQEIVEFAKRMGFQKIGIATCAGLIRESRILAKILRSHDFDVYSAVCKVGAVPKTDVGIDEKCNAVGKNMCNPITQATLLNEAGTQFNIVMGLCVGHDSLFYKYSEALVTTLVAKDRVTGHNPAAALYTAESYYQKLFAEKE